MSSWQTLWGFVTDNFTVTLACTEEPDPDLSWDDGGEAERNIESGLWGNYLFRVQVLHDGNELGSSYLGNSIYEDPADFRTEHFGLAPKSRADGVTYGAYFPGMVSEAIAEARAALVGLQSIPLRKAA